MINVIVMGIGAAYRKRRDIFEENFERIRITGFLDNSAVKGQVLEGITVYKPDEIYKLNYDGIVISSNKYKDEMKKQLLELGVSQEKIWDFMSLRKYCYIGEKKTYGIDKNISFKRKNVLIISTDMDFSGGTLVAIYAAQALSKNGYYVRLAAPSINDKLLVEIMEMGLSVTIWPALPYMYNEDKEWVSQFNIVIVNVFQMMNCAYFISQFRPVLWWIHEVHSPWVDFYQQTRKQFQAIDSNEWMNRRLLKVMGVSNNANYAFDFFYPNIIAGTLPFGIPDEFKEHEEVIKSDKTIFAVLAGYAEFKGQDILIDAIELLPIEMQEAIEVWFIGPSNENRTALERKCANMGNVRFCGRLTHEEVIIRLNKIDVIVCPSLIESMSMAIMEGMMFNKICIASSGTGIAEYIQNGKNGYIFENGNSISLAKCLIDVIKKKGHLEKMKMLSRQTYDNYFSIEVFGKRLLENIKQLEKEDM